MSPHWLAAAAIAAGVLVLTTPSKAYAAAKRPREGSPYRLVYDLAHDVEARTGIPGFTDFALAVATSESKGNPFASNTSVSEAAAAARGYEANKNGRYALNPYPPEDFTFGSGGLYGFLPSTALADKHFHNMDPLLVFNPQAATVFLATLVRRIVRNHFGDLPADCRNWLTVRRFMASNEIGLDCSQQRERSRNVRIKFVRQLKERGADPRLASRRVRIKHWPGADVLFAEMVNT